MHCDYTNLSDLSAILSHYRNEQTELEEYIEFLEAAGCPYPQYQYPYKMLRDYNIPPFEGDPSSYPATWQDHVNYMECVNRFHTLPYKIRDINKFINQASKKP